MSSIGISAQNNFLQVTQTAQKSRDRLTAKNPIPLDPARPKSEDDEVISVSLSTTYQRIRGFGGAFTDSTAYLFNELSEEKQAQVIDAYFGDSGNKYSLCRLHNRLSDNYNMVIRIILVNILKCIHHPDVYIYLLDYNPRLKLPSSVQYFWLLRPAFGIRNLSFRIWNIIFGFPTP